MSDRYHYGGGNGYARRSKRRSLGSGGDWNNPVKLALLAGVAILITTFWHAVFGVVLALAAAAGFGALIWKLEGDFIKLKTGLLSFRIALARCKRRRKSLSDIEARKHAINDRDFHKAVVYAKQQSSTAVRQLVQTRIDLSNTIAVRRRTIRRTREKVLQRAPSLTEKKLKRRLDKLTCDDDGLKALHGRIDSEVNAWSKR